MKGRCEMRGLHRTIRLFGLMALVGVCFVNGLMADKTNPNNSKCLTPLSPANCSTAGNTYCQAVYTKSGQKDCNGSCAYCTSTDAVDWSACYAYEGEDCTQQTTYVDCGGYWKNGFCQLENGACNCGQPTGNVSCAVRGARLYKCSL
jgi:hypothetical protein